MVLPVFDQCEFVIPGAWLMAGGRMGGYKLSRRDGLLFLIIPMHMTNQELIPGR